MWGRMSNNMEHRFSPNHLAVKIEENNNIISEGQNLSGEGQNCLEKGHDEDEGNKSNEVENSSVKSQNDIVNKIIRNHYHENLGNPTMEKQYRCCISTDRLNQLRKIVEDAIVERKSFTIKGGYQSVRNALLQRGWIEKYEMRPPVPANAALKPVSTPPTMDDVCSNLPVKQDWESLAAHVSKCEKMIISRLLQNHEVAFYWNLRKDSAEWTHRLTKHKIINRFSRSLFTSKEGLCLLLQQMYWHNEPGVSFVRFPRCYTINFADQCTAFIDDFRITACISLLKWFVQKINKDGEFTIATNEGKVPITAIQFAIDRCNDFVNIQKHLDIDREFHKVWDHEWEQFITNFHLLIHKNQVFAENTSYNLFVLETSAKAAIKNIVPFWPQFELDGVNNVWIMKPGNKCRGRDIKLIKDVSDVIRVMNNKLKYVVQKYIERPLLIYNTKFDIRQWFMVTCVQPLTIWMYRDCYLRFSSRKFCLEDFHEAVHLTNHAIQHKYNNANERDKALPQDNMWDNHTFKTFLRQIGQAEKWYKVIYPGMRESIIGTMLASQDTMDRRPNTFELYGADFMIAENFTPWLIEINSCPAMGPTTSVTARMCPQCFEDVIKVVIDRRKDPKADTGLFECVYKQNLPQSPAYMGMMLSIKGKKLFKKRSAIEKKRTDKSPCSFSGRRYSMQDHVLPKRDLDLKNYNGPIIENLIEEIHGTLFRHAATDNCNDLPPTTHDIEVIAENKPITEKRPKLQEFQILAEKNAMQEKRHRVQEFQILTEKTSMPNIIINNNSNVINNKNINTNKKTSFHSKLQDIQKESSPIKRKCSCTAKSNPQIKSPSISLRASPKPIKKKSIPYFNKNWEQETASILKNSICLSSAPVNCCRRYRSKSFVTLTELKNNAALNNNILPDIDIKNSPVRKLSSNLLTVGTGYKNNNFKPFSNENLLSLTKPIVDNSLKVEC